MRSFSICLMSSGGYIHMNVFFLFTFFGLGSLVFLTFLLGISCFFFHGAVHLTNKMPLTYPEKDLKYFMKIFSFNRFRI